MIENLTVAGQRLARPSTPFGAVGRPPTTAADGTQARIGRFLDELSPETPCLVIDLATVAHRYRELLGALPESRIFYAVKANPEREVIRLLVRLGACFDVASPAEIKLCLDEGAAPKCLSYGNTIKKRADIAWAYSVGVRTFTTDSEQDLTAIAEVAPGSAVFCRMLVDNVGSRTPFGLKFGCSAEMAADLLSRAPGLGLRPLGVSFHVGSQQLSPSAWNGAIAEAARVFTAVERDGTRLTVLNLGGGLPATYTQPTPALGVYAAAIRESVLRHFGTSPELVIEPGRSIVGDAGLLRTQIVLVSRKSTADEHRWIYLDVGRYNGLAETEGEAITYRLDTPHQGKPAGPVILAGPTCDGDDVLYQRTVYHLPMDLRAGDHVDILSAGAYTASYASVAFNGFRPLPTYCVRSMS